MLVALLILVLGNSRKARGNEPDLRLYELRITKYEFSYSVLFGIFHFDLDREYLAASIQYLI